MYGCIGFSIGWQTNLRLWLSVAGYKSPTGVCYRRVCLFVQAMVVRGYDNYCGPVCILRPSR